jgi:acyl-CoA hydrolase
MYGDASVAPSYFDGIVDNPKYTFPLFGPPNRTVDTVEYLIALHVTTLIRDGGTLQIGIGALEDAVTVLLKLRHQQNELYREILTDSDILERFSEIIELARSSRDFMLHRRCWLMVSSNCTAAEF